MWTREQIDKYEFTKAQKAAYKQLVKYCKKCRELGLILDARQSKLNAYPEKMYDAGTIDFSEYENFYTPLPVLEGASIVDAGSDESYYINDKFIKY